MPATQLPWLPVVLQSVDQKLAGMDPYDQARWVGGSVGGVGGVGGVGAWVGGWRVGVGEGGHTGAPFACANARQRHCLTGNCRVCIVSHDMVRKLGDRLAPFRTVIADESHHLKVGG